MAAISSASAISVTSHSPNPASIEEMMQIFDLEILSTVPNDYFFKKELIRNLLDGHSLQELQAIYQDYFLLKDKTFENAIKDQFPRQYVVTAGGPGAGKSTILESYLSKHEGFAYVDPDRTCLLHMENTYKKDMASGETAQNSYTKWRNASNFIATVLMCTALQQGYNLAHGSTMTSPYSKFEFQAAKRYGYNRRILHITCPNEVRFASEKIRRESGIVQCTDEDLESKGKDFFRRLADYLQNAEMIDFYLRSDMTTVTKAATKTSTGLIEITDITSFMRIKEMHNHEMNDEYYWDRFN